MCAHDIRAHLIMFCYSWLTDLLLFSFGGCFSATACFTIAAAVGVSDVVAVAVVAGAAGGVVCVSIDAHVSVEDG